MVQLYTPLLRNWLLRQPLQTADVDDLVQDVLVVVVRRVPEFRHHGGPGAFRHWLRTILANRLRYYWRQRLGRPEAAGGLEAVGLLEQLETPDSAIGSAWDLEHDRHVVARLLELIHPEFTAATWEAFHRYALQGLPAAEVAATLGISVNAVCIARSRVLRRLRQEAQGDCWTNEPGRGPSIFLKGRARCRDLLW
jgi:RNA polymerase sigma-70 factor (ECF subfamily)